MIHCHSLLRIRLVKGRWSAMKSINLEGLRFPKEMLNQVGRGLDGHPCSVQQVAKIA